MTIVDFVILRRIRLSEYYNQAWSKDPKKAPNVTEAVETFNKVSTFFAAAAVVAAITHPLLLPLPSSQTQMTYWIASEIIKAKDDKRTVTLSRFIEVGEHLRALQNYHSLMAVFSALSLGPVQLFQQTWKGRKPFTFSTPLHPPLLTFACFKRSLIETQGNMEIDFVIDGSQWQL
jgi:hypothetical protein